MHQALAALFAFLLSTAALAQTTVPHNFTAGAPARASEVNANFSALASAIDALAGRVAALESPTLTMASLAGSYRFTSLELGISAASGANASGYLQVSPVRSSGTLTLAAGGAVSVSLTSEATHGRIEYSPAPNHVHAQVPSGTTAGAASGSTVSSSLTRETDPHTVPGTWTLTNGEIVITFTGAGTVRLLPASSRLLIGANLEAGSDTDSYTLDVLVRQ